MANTTVNTSAFQHAQQYSNFILTNLHEALLPDIFTRMIQDFSKGSTLDIKTIGTRNIQDVTEDEGLVATPIDSSTIQMTISEWIGDLFYITDKLREDGDQVDRLIMESAQESLRAIVENYETKFLKKCNDSQTDANANVINGFAHRIASGETNDVITLNHIINMKKAFDKANVPSMGRVAIVDPVVGATLDKLTNLVNVSNNPKFEGVVTQGFAKDARFLYTIYGWDIYTSNMLDKGSFGDGTETVADGVANVFMSVAQDNTKPIMSAWRRSPTTATWREENEERDMFKTTARFGFGTQRVDTLGTIITSASNSE